MLLCLLCLVDATGLALAYFIDWAKMPGSEAGIVSAIISSVVTGATAQAASVVGYYFNSSPTAS